MGCDDLTLQGRLKQSNRDIRFSATTPFYFRPDKRGRSREKRRERRKAVTGLCSAATSAAAPDAAVAGRPPRRYIGRPFSYFAFLEKAVRPTNMARQTQTHILPYSEL